MHYSNLVIIHIPLGLSGNDENDKNIIEEAVAEVMGPDEEHGGFYDWYEIGGRWTGALDGYEPYKDPRNIETCRLCSGTGNRDDDIGKKAREGNPNYTCNGCDGTGKRVKWPTQWGFHRGDVMPVSQLTEEHLKTFYRVVLPRGYGEFARERYEPWRSPSESAFVKQNMPTLEWIKKEFSNHLCVVVDNHS